MIWTALPLNIDGYLFRDKMKELLSGTEKTAVGNKFTDDQCSRGKV